MVYVPVRAGRHHATEMKKNTERRPGQRIRRISNGIMHKVPDFLRARLHQESASKLRQLCDDACDSVFIENSGVARKWVATPFWSDSIVFNENRIASVIAAFTLTLGINGPLELNILASAACCCPFGWLGLISSKMCRSAKSEGNLNQAKCFSVTAAILFALSVISGASLILFLFTIVLKNGR